MKEKIKYAGASGNTSSGKRKKLLGLLLAVFMVLYTGTDNCPGGCYNRELDRFCSR